jgi:hypothetical protein
MEVFSYLPLQIDHMLFVVLKHFQWVNIKGNNVHIETTPTYSVAIVEGSFNRKFTKHGYGTIATNSCWRWSLLVTKDPRGGRAL